MHIKLFFHKDRIERDIEQDRNTEKDREKERERDRARERDKKKKKIHIKYFYMKLLNNSYQQTGLIYLSMMLYINGHVHLSICLLQAAIKVIDFEDEHTRGLILMEIKVVVVQRNELRFQP